MVCSYEYFGALPQKTAPLRNIGAAGLDKLQAD
jgi:hypothetical protein